MSSVDCHPNTAVDDEEEFMFALRMATASVLPMVLKAAIELDVLQIMAGRGPGAELSSSELASLLPKHNPEAPSLLERMMRLLAAHSILTANTRTHADGRVEKVYGLAPMSKFLVRNKDGVSYAPLLLFTHDKVMMENWFQVKDVILGGGELFTKAHKMKAYEYLSRDDRFNNLFNKAMADSSTIILKKTLETYRGFYGLSTLVSVGGGTGASLHVITSNYPHIKAINFDLPHVIADAPRYPGVEHVAGDMFVSIPSAEAILIQGALTDWREEQCLQILENCYKALPESGKVIIMELVIPDATETTKLAAQGIFQLDLTIITFSAKVLRMVKEYQALAERAGFNGFGVMCNVYGCHCTMECYKHV